MKNFKSIFILLFISIFIYSCDNEEGISAPENLNEQIVPGVLSSITLERFSCNVSSATVNFQNNKITDVQYSSGGKSEFGYTTDLLTERLVYHGNGLLLFTYIYDYDSSGRIIEINRFANYDNPIVDENSASRVESLFGYDNSNYITRKDFWYNADETLSESNVDFTQYYFLNDQQLIKKYESLGWHLDYLYANNNPSAITDSDNYESVTMTHFDGVNMSGYKLKDYFFGEHWKNNSNLAFFNILVGQTIIELTGDDLLKSYEVLDANGNLKRTLNVTYEVDEQGRLKHQYREFTSNGSPYSETVTYNFED